MRIFKSIADAHFNSESTYKINRLSIHMENFKSLCGAEFEGLVELSNTPYLAQFLTEYAPAQNGAPLPLTNLSKICLNSPDFDLLMAYVYDGGSLAKLMLHSDNKPGDVKGLITQVFSNSPQALLVNSGLQPTDFASEMYLSLVREIVTIYPDEISKVLDEASQEDRTRMYLAMTSVAKAAGINIRGLIEVDKIPSSRAVSLLTGKHRELKGSTRYLLELSRHAKFELGTDQLSKSLGCIFMADAFEKAMEIKNSRDLVKELTARAYAWAYHLKCPKFQMSSFVKQLLASALCTNPSHYKKIGFTNGNLLGLSVNRDLIGLIKTVSDGPMALLVRPEIDENQLLNCLEYIHELAPYFALNDMYEDSGFRHTNAINILRAIGGHCLGAEFAAVEEVIEPEKVLSLLRVIWTTDSYKKYSAEALVNLMSFYIDRLPLRVRDGSTRPMDCLELTTDMKERARAEFGRAYIENPGFKALFIERIEKTEGLTADHLSLFCLRPDDIPGAMKRLHRKDRGSLLEDELGL